jgi:dolichol-phosphate mannosyltransferase
MADFRLLDRQVVHEILKLKEGGLFLRGMVHWVGYPSAKVEFQCRDRLAGESKYNFRKMLKFAWNGVTSFSLIPLRMTIVLGFCTSLIAFFHLIHAVWAKLFTDTAVPGWATIVAIVSLLFGILFIQLGVLGEYLGRVLEEVRERPHYIVSEHTGLTLPDTSFTATRRSSPRLLHKDA